MSPEQRTSSEGSKTTGKVEFYGEACKATGELEGHSYKTSVPNSNYDGTVDAQVSAVDYTMTFGGSVQGQRITGRYQVLTGQPCMGTTGEFELSRAATPTDSEKTLSRMIWIVLQDDRVTGVAESVHPTQRR